MGSGSACAVSTSSAPEGDILPHVVPVVSGLKSGHSLFNTKMSTYWPLMHLAHKIRLHFAWQDNLGIELCVIQTVKAMDQNSISEIPSFPLTLF